MLAHRSEYFCCKPLDTQRHKDFSGVFLLLRKIIYEYLHSVNLHVHIIQVRYLSSLLKWEKEPSDSNHSEMTGYPANGCEAWFPQYTKHCHTTTVFQKESTRIPQGSGGLSLSPGIQLSCEIL